MKLYNGDILIAEGDISYSETEKGWVTPVGVFVDAEKAYTLDKTPIVSPVEFLLLFTPTERVAIKSVRSTDPIIDDLFGIIEDARLTAVNLGLKSTQDALDYLVSQSLITSDRKAEILTGVIK